MEIKQDIVRLFIEDGEKRAILFRNGLTEFYMLRRATNDDVDELLGVSREMQIPIKKGAAINAPLIGSMKLGDK